MEKPKHEAYRDNVAEVLKSIPDAGDKMETLEQLKQTQAYKSAKQLHNEGRERVSLDRKESIEWEKIENVIKSINDIYYFPFAYINGGRRNTLQQIDSSISPEGFEHLIREFRFKVERFHDSITKLGVIDPALSQSIEELQQKCRIYGKYMHSLDPYGRPAAPLQHEDVNDFLSFFQKFKPIFVKCCKEIKLILEQKKAEGYKFDLPGPFTGGEDSDKGNIELWGESFK